MSRGAIGIATAGLATVGLALGCGDDVTASSTDGSGTMETPAADSTTGSTMGSPSGQDESAGGCAEPFTLECPEGVEVQCQGPSTPVSVPTPIAACDEWTVGGDVPAQLPPGDSTVEFTLDGDGMSTACTTVITVVDDDPPFIDCPDPGPVLRASADVEVPPPPVNADDLCWDALDIVATPSVLTPGPNTVEYTATDGSGNSVSCTTELELFDAFAVEGFRLIAGRLTEAGDTEVTLAWEPRPLAPITGYRIETAAQADGPWAPVQTVGADELLYTTTLAASSAWYRVVIESELGDGGVTAPRQAFAVVDELYDLRDVPVAGIPFDTTLYGVVRSPVALAEGPFPLVLVMHGNHGNCRDPQDPNDDFCSTSEDHECSFASGDTAPNAHGYDYLLETLAAQGMVTVSISGNAMNCRDDYIIERARLVIEHLRRWSDWQEGEGALGGSFAGALDLTRVGLVGHSRGGDAVSNVPGVLADDPIPGLAVASVFAVAPTDYQDVVVRDTPMAVLLPACDGDVADLSGVRHYDRSIAFDDGVEQAQVLYVGANHNYFNTEWRLSEWELFGGIHPYCEPAAGPQKREQQAMLEATVGSWFGATLGDEPTEGFVRADRPSPVAFDAWAGAPLELRWSYSAAERVAIDDFEGPETPEANDLGGANAFSDWLLWEVCAATGCDAAYPHLRRSLRLLWEEGLTPRARFELGGYDATAAGMLSFRVVSRFSSLNTGLEQQDFFIRVIDEAGVEAQFPLSEIKALGHLYPHTNGSILEVLQTVRIPVASLVEREPALDLSGLQALEFEMTALDRSGSVIITDLEFAP